ncbi:MAG: SDR family NAD(P)-dependent oxidoreductase [Planctomycetota bacterium]|nr:MAG: SDR family NAD(P)-dependent oxidoreductase [Planctomycetota bacterium]
MSRIVVTGGAGFIGSHLCEALLARGHEVVALDNLDDFYDPAVKRANLAQALSSERFTFVEGDIRDREAVERVLSGNVEAVVHLAARAGVRPSIADPVLYEQVNVHGTTVLLEACRRRGVRRFVFGSSSSVYGNNRKVPFSESDPVDRPISPYAATKRAGELLCHTYDHLFGMDVTCVRLFTVYGPRQRPDLAIHKFARLMEAGRPVPVFGDGSMRRDFTYIADIVDGLCRALERCAGYHQYNLGESQPVSVMELVAGLEKALGRKAVIEHHPQPPGDVDQTYADVTLARRELGYEPKTDLADGLARFVAWLRSQA